MMMMIDGKEERTESYRARVTGKWKSVTRRENKNKSKRLLKESDGDMAKATVRNE